MSDSADRMVEAVKEYRIFELYLNLRNLDRKEIQAYLSYTDEQLEEIYKRYMYADTDPTG